MTYSEIMIRYGELSTKGKNKKDFIKKLKANVKKILDPFPQAELEANYDRMYIYLNGESYQGIASRLQEVFGIQSFSPVRQVEKSLAAMQAAAVKMVQDNYQEGQSFKVSTRRADKDFPLDTLDINRQVGGAVTAAIPSIQVKMKEPDIQINIDLRKDGVFFYTDQIDGLGGMPVGTGGKASLMLSGGIDSPVAAYLTLKRGVELDLVHFHSPPYTSPQALQKAKDLSRIIAKYGGPMHFITVPFTAIQEAIKKECPDSLSMTLNRRFMLRITDRIRQQRGGLAIVNGESIGQVASQTLESMYAINEVTSTPVFRPLLSMDKTEIIDLAKEIGSFDLSTQPYEDCCTVFAPQKPKTKPDLQEVKKWEDRLDIDGLIAEALTQIDSQIMTHDENDTTATAKQISDLL